MTHRLLLAFVFTTCIAAASAFKAGHGYGENYSAPDGLFAVHATASDFPMEGSPLYNVSVNGKYVGLYNDRNFWGGLVHFGAFEFENGRPVTIRISYYQPIKSYELLPSERLSVLSVKKVGRSTIEIRTDRADQNFTLVVNGELKKNVLHLFAQSIDHSAPAQAQKHGYTRDEKEKLFCFGPGTYDLKALTGNDMLVLPDGWKVYIAAGAVVKGRIGLWGTSAGTMVCGRGMVYNDTTDPHVIFEANECKGAGVYGVTFHCHRKGVWQVVINHSRNVEFKNVKIISTRYASTDGLDIVNSQQCSFLNTFIRASDDAIAIKGLDSRKPAECPPTRNLTFCGMELWNDCNCAMGIGAENKCSLYENIRFLNSSILFSYDDPDYHDCLDERAAMTICCIHGTFFRNISYENIDVYHAERLIAAGFQPSFWFGALPGDQTTEGGIDGLTYRNVRLLRREKDDKLSGEIHLYGWNKPGTPVKKVENVKMENVTIEGKGVKEAGVLHVGPEVYNLDIRP